MVRQMILSVLLIVLGLLWGGAVGAQETEKTIYNDPDLAYQEAVRRIEEKRTSLSRETHRSVRDLSFHGLALTTVPPEIKFLTELTHLDFGNTRLTFLPREIGYLKQLTYLGLYNVSLSPFPPSILYLTGLKQIIIGGETLTQFPVELATLKSLREIYIGHVSWITLPVEITRMTQITKLTVMDSQLRYLPPEIGNMTQLESLSIVNTPLQALPLEFGQLTNLTHLDLTDTSITFPSPDIMEQGIPTISAYLRKTAIEQQQAVAMMRQTIAGIATGVGAIVGVILAFRWRQRRGLQEKKKRV